MAAELQYLESIEESVRQLGDVERLMGVSMAQQESVSLAQMLKVMKKSEIICGKNVNLHSCFDIFCIASCLIVTTAQHLRNLYHKLQHLHLFHIHVNSTWLRIPDNCIYLEFE